jgi:DNA-binding CsgD family transcriptional regulator
VVLLERPDAVEAVARNLRAQGWSVRSGWDLPAAPWDLRPERWLASGVVTDLAGARDALLALRRTAGVVIVVDLPAASRLDVLADLHRLGEVRTEAGAAVAAALPITAEQRELLQRLADGESVPEAAAALFLSQRTAERRLALTRKALGVRSTAEAIGRLLSAGRAG